MTSKPTFRHSLTARDWAVFRKVWTLNACERELLQKYFMLRVSSAAVQSHLEWEEDAHRPFFNYRDWSFELEFLGNLSETWFCRMRGQEYLMSCRVLESGAGIALVRLIDPETPHNAETLFLQE